MGLFTKTTRGASPELRAARGAAPAQQSPPSAWLECRSRLQTFLNALAPLASPEMVGQPFGEAFGLEDALSLVPRHFVNAQDVREADHMVAVDIVMGTGDRFMPDDLDVVMGATEQAFRLSEIAPAQFGAVTSLTGAAKTFLGQLDEEGQNMWELWKRRDDVAAEFLSWHAVARLRLVTAGKMDPVQPVAS